MNKIVGFCHLTGVNAKFGWNILILDLNHNKMGHLCGFDGYTSCYFN